MNEFENIIRFDWAAKRILRDKANFSVLEGFVSVLLGQVIRIKEFVDVEDDAESNGPKFNGVMFTAENIVGEPVIVDLQFTRKVHYYERKLPRYKESYLNMVFLGESCRHINKLYVISVLNFDYSGGKDCIFHGEKVLQARNSDEILLPNEKEHWALGLRSFNGLFPEYYLIIPDRFNQTAVTPLEEWLLYLKSNKIRVSTTIKGLQLAMDKLKISNLNDSERRQYERYVENLWIEKDCLETAWLEGYVEGRLQAR